MFPPLVTTPCLAFAAFAFAPGFFPPLTLLKLSSLAPLCSWTIKVRSLRETYACECRCT
jgi:hypothetical protein